ncbi:hypothetical protein [Microvirga sp. VF16]|uniref:hypothetical protein n=1 Tax=Microvirga sp. VF16 TaxID=2807101 RepID=UPI00193E79ED|nr:hypothetical protein [Microvirga sp. VF16]QRM31128.1 hypothetical protein JO965_09095 [Microvirga sp. VF16]
MARVILSAAILLAGLGAARAQTSCYPRIGAYSGQYEGQCPNSSLKWTAVENTVGAFGRNCGDEPWTYNRTEKMFYNPKANENFAMQDCHAPSRDQLMSAVRATMGTDMVRRFHENKIQRPGITAEQSSANR